MLFQPLTPYIRHITLAPLQNGGATTSSPPLQCPLYIDSPCACSWSQTFRMSFCKYLEITMLPNTSQYLPFPDLGKDHDALHQMFVRVEQKFKQIHLIHKMPFMTLKIV